MLVYIVGECIHIVCIKKMCFSVKTNMFEQQFFVNTSRMPLYIKHPCWYKFSIFSFSHFSGRVFLWCQCRNLNL